MIYFDNAATTAPFSYIIDHLKDYAEVYGNPSSRHQAGRNAKKVLEKARTTLANAIHCEPEQLFFTSGGTESNNIIIDSLCKERFEKKGRIISTSIEHDSILNCLKMRKAEGFDVVLLNVDKNGYVDPKELEAAITPTTFLISIQYVNNEIGTVQNIRKLSEIAHRKGIFFHSDCVQAVGHYPIDVRQLGLDAISSSAHKFNGIKGTGFLYSNKPILPVIGGGGQEHNVKPGTENLVGIQAMSDALQISLADLEEKRQKIFQCVRWLEDAIRQVQGCQLNVDLQGYHSIVNFRCDLLDNEALLALLDIKGICCSAGSACLGNGNSLSHVLRAIKMTDESIQHSIRISLSSDNNLEECKAFINILKGIVSRNL